MENNRKRNPQVNFSCTPEMYHALDWLAKQMKLKGRPDVVRILIVEPLKKKLEEYGFNDLKETDH